MWKWIVGGLLVVVISYAVNTYYRLGFHTMPEIPDGAFVITRRNGFQAILVDVPDLQGARTYFQYPVVVPFYLEKAWAICKPPIGDEAQGFRESIKSNPGERFEAVCKIKVDEDIVIRGLITSVPKL